MSGRDLRLGGAGWYEDGTSGRSGQSIAIVSDTGGPVAYSVCHDHDHPCRHRRRGVFAPGHLGELTQYLPFELVDDVLAQTRTVQRLRDLPSPSEMALFEVVAGPLAQPGTPGVRFGGLRTDAFEGCNSLR